MTARGFNWIVTEGEEFHVDTEMRRIRKARSTAFTSAVRLTGGNTSIATARPQSRAYHCNCVAPVSGRGQLAARRAAAGQNEAACAHRRAVRHAEHRQAPGAHGLQPVAVAADRQPVANLGEDMFEQDTKAAWALVPLDAPKQDDRASIETDLSTRSGQPCRPAAGKLRACPGCRRRHGPIHQGRRRRAAEPVLEEEEVAALGDSEFALPRAAAMRPGCGGRYDALAS